MFKLMVADDNNYILQDLTHNVAWESFGLELIGSYSDGQELLDAAEEQMPDVVITDIVMPVITGFELTSRLYERNPRVKVIFISGHTEFEYATTALKLHVFDYLVKPIRRNQLEQVMTKLITQLHLEREQELHRSHTKSQLTSLRQTSLTHYLSRLLFYSGSETEIRRKLSALGLVLPKPFELYMVCFRVSSPYQEELSDTCLYSVAQQQLPDIFLPLITEKNKGSLLLIFSNQTLTVATVLQRFCSMVEAEAGCRLTVSYSDPVTQFSELPHIYKQALSTMKHMLTVDTGVSYLSYHNMHSKTVPENEKKPSPSPYGEQVAAMRKFIEEKYAEPISAADVAECVYLSTGHANLLFSNECNISIFRYIVWYRIKVAKQLLSETDLHISLIAERVGYSSKTSFYLSFKRNTGLSPSEYREKYASLS